MQQFGEQKQQKTVPKSINCNKPTAILWKDEDN
jgi:hypothetical protein